MISHPIEILFLLLKKELTMSLKLGENLPFEKKKSKNNLEV